FRKQGKPSKPGTAVPMHKGQDRSINPAFKWPGEIVLSVEMLLKPRPDINCPNQERQNDCTDMRSSAPKWMRRFPKIDNRRPCEDRATFPCQHCQGQEYRSGTPCQHSSP